MTLGELIAPEHVLSRLRAGDKSAVLAELGRRAATACGLPAAEVTAALAARETLGSTGIGSGIGVPHARLENLAKPVGFFARLDRPIDFAAVDGKPVDLVCLLLSPAQEHGAHLAALAAISRRLRDANVAEALRRKPDAAAMHVLLTGNG